MHVCIIRTRTCVCVPFFGGMSQSRVKCCACTRSNRNRTRAWHPHKLQMLDWSDNVTTETRVVGALEGQRFCFAFERRQVMFHLGSWLEDAPWKMKKQTRPRTWRACTSYVSRPVSDTQVRCLYILQKWENIGCCSLNQPQTRSPKISKLLYYIPQFFSNYRSDTCNISIILPKGTFVYLVIIVFFFPLPRVVVTYLFFFSNDATHPPIVFIL